MSGAGNTPEEWNDFLSGVNGPIGKKKRAFLVNLIRSAGVAGLGGEQAVAVTVPAASQAVGASFSSGRQQRPLRGTGASPAWASLPPRPDTTARRMASPLGNKDA